MRTYISGFDSVDEVIPIVVGDKEVKIERAILTRKKTTSDPRLIVAAGGDDEQK
ncbi:MAG: hypothetical protein K2J18_09445 [Paramuribaculum sp.]|nr:hypothetical protein [Paramuribaculum sp.]MDE7471225.1 hypothetical protein [Paramuribaculum sp.]